MEEAIVRLFVRSVLAAGYLLTVNNGGDDDEIEASTDEAAIINVMREASEDTVYLHRPGQTKQHFGWVMFVYGNDGYDVICDYTTNLEGLLRPCTDLANTYDV